MPTDTNSPDPELPPMSSGIAPPSAVRPAPPGMIAGVGSIISGVVGFGVPVLGILVACLGIGLGILAIRQARRARARSSLICGIIGISLSVLSIVFWVCAVLFESYH
jgi:hypothetical protein